MYPTPLSESSLGVQKSPPAMTSAEMTCVVKSVKIAAGGSCGHTRTSDFDELTKAVLEDAITVYKGHLFTEGAFLEHSEEYDVAVQSFIFICKTWNIQMDIDDDLMKLITQCSSQAHGDCKSKACPLVPLAFGIGMDKPIHDMQNINPIIQMVLNVIWFKNKNDEGAMNPNFLKDRIPLPVIALVFTVIECCLDEWQTRQHVDVQFTAAGYKNKYEEHLKILQEYDKQMKDAGIIPKLHQSLAKQAQKCANIVDKPTAHTVQIDNVDLKAAKKDWEDFDDSNEDKEGNKDED
ncbi:hypothetical protein EDD18DRAFT_1358223 [Armillaria luteobubalina]|uniref:DUF6532 domain-containing protein n=1 Tax=Armillaria luteobubalina TaxID=153913 RepID=A0AA39PXX9_9AGAR|nr:hypothetical protein EDD18DRAFT_1358223 [Armillaria luteobubalina]